MSSSSHTAGRRRGHHRHRGPRAPGGRRPEGEPVRLGTDTDRALERHTRRVLAAECAGVPVVGEEYGIDHGATTAPYRWVVDPVDGTADYVAGLPWFAYSLALLDARGRWSASSPTRVAQIHAAARGRGVRANGVAVRPTARAAVGRLVCSELGGARAPGFTRAAVAAHTGVRVLAPRSWRSPA